MSNVLNDFISRRRKDDSIVILQSNNYTSLPEHINCVKDENELADKTKLKMNHESFTSLKLTGEKTVTVVQLLF